MTQTPISYIWNFKHCNRIYPQKLNYRYNNGFAMKETIVHSSCHTNVTLYSDANIEKGWHFAHGQRYV